MGNRHPHEAARIRQITRVQGKKGKTKVLWDFCFLDLPDQRPQRCSITSWLSIHPGLSSESVLRQEIKWKVIDAFLSLQVRRKMNRNVTNTGLSAVLSLSVTLLSESLIAVRDGDWQILGGVSNVLPPPPPPPHSHTLSPLCSPLPVMLFVPVRTREARERLRRTVGSAPGWSAGRWGTSWARRCSRCRRRVRTGTPAWCGCRCRWGRWCAPPSGGSGTAAAPAGCAAQSSRCRGCSPLLFGLWSETVTESQF